MSKKKGPAVALSFIDILFAVVVGVGLTGVVGKPWVADFFANVNALDLWVFVLANTVVVASWVGYHKMMAGAPATDGEPITEPLDPEIRTVQGFLRFLIDIVLLFLYFRMLVEIDHPILVLGVIVWVFVLYVGWDCIVITEHPIGKRGGVTIMWAIFFLAAFLVGRYALSPANHIAWLCLLLGSIDGAVSYRLQKWHKTFADSIAVWISAKQDSLLGRFRKKGIQPLRIYVAGPYTADSECKILDNVRSAIDASLKLYQKGHLPYVPHLTHYIDKRAQELGVQIPREDYVRRWDMPWLELCDAVLFLAESPGAIEEVQVARRMGKTVFDGDPGAVPEASGAG